jgi:hypothetical protein
MPWWAWVLVGWAVVATVLSSWLAAAAGTARHRERALRAHQYPEAALSEFREAG